MHILAMSTENNASTASIPKPDQSRNNNNYNRNGRGPPRSDSRSPRTPEDRVRGTGATGSTGGAVGSGGGGGGYTLVLKNPYKVQRIRVQQEPPVVRENRRDNTRTSTDARDDDNRRPRAMSSDSTSANAVPKKKSTFAVSTDDDASESAVKFKSDFGSNSNGRYLMIRKFTRSRIFHMKRSRCFLFSKMPRMLCFILHKRFIINILMMSTTNLVATYQQCNVFIFAIALTHSFRNQPIAY